MTLLRPQLEAQGILTADTFAQLPNGARVDVAGLVTIRQRPSTANGAIFVTLEDETGLINVIVWPNLAMWNLIGKLNNFRNYLAHPTPKRFFMCGRSFASMPSTYVETY